MAGLQGLQLLNQGIGAGSADMLDRAATERGETGAEDHPGIEQVGIGNHAVIITEPNDALCQTYKAFLESMHFAGFSNFDIKYDPRDGKYKAFEINTRQGRSNYYVTGAGYNLAQILVDDRVKHIPLELTITQNRSLWRVVPQKVAYDYTPQAHHAEMKALIQAGAVKNPIFYGPDKNPVRLLRMIKNALGHFVKFKQYYAKPKD